MSTITLCYTLVIYCYSTIVIFYGYSILYYIILYYGTISHKGLYKNKNI